MIQSVAGPELEYISNIDFSLNFEDKKNSVKVKVGDLLLYDGVIAKYKKSTGEEVVGRTHSLRSAITNNWLSLNNGETRVQSPLNVRVEQVRDSIVRDGIVYKTPDYDSKKGGGFDEYLAKETGDIGVIRQEDQIVKRTAKTNAATTVEENRKKLEVVPENAVPTSEMASGSTLVTSTTTPSNMRRSGKPTVISAEDNNRVTPMKRTAKLKEEKDGVKTFTVDDRTPKVAEDSTLAEVRRATEVIPDERQDGQVVKKVGEKRKMVVVADGESGAQIVKKIGVPNPTKTVEEEGITFRKTETTTSAETEEGISFSKGQPRQSSGEVQVRPAMEPIADLSGIRTQAEVDEIERKLEEKKTAAGKNYVNLLPKDWSTWHWVQKEKFIMQIPDKEFVKFLLMVETAKAIQNACRKRLLELEKQALRNG